jgi:hypothetical protein
LDGSPNSWALSQVEVENAEKTLIDLKTSIRKEHSIHERIADRSSTDHASSPYHSSKADDMVACVRVDSLTSMPSTVWLTDAWA